MCHPPFGQPIAAVASGCLFHRPEAEPPVVERNAFHQNLRSLGRRNAFGLKSTCGVTARPAANVWRFPAAPNMTNGLFLDMNKRTFAIALSGAALAAVLPLASAATVTTVPMQGAMAMPMVAYHADLGHLGVMLPADIPQLTPLLVSNPGDSFDPGDPWYESLDPSRQGQSFSRRYGFVMDAATDLLPAGTQIWIRKLASSPGLSVYRYASSSSKAWEPIFGTAGTANAMSWNGMMFHPAFTAPPDTNALAATFEAYLVETSNGTEVPGSSSGPFVLNFTNVPDGRPALTLGARMVVAWPADAAGYVLEGTDDLSDGNWTAVTNAPVIVEGESVVLLPRDEARRFFRMKRTP